MQIIYEVRERMDKAWSIYGKDFRHLLSMPFIYGMIVPVLLFDIMLWLYQTFAFPLYDIPKVDRRDYITYDRKYLSYLNLMQKVNCIYCSYVNGFLGYATEVAARTERYWCPIKNKNRMKGEHRWHSEFADYQDEKQFEKKYNDESDFA